MKIRYIGDETAPRVTTAFGYDFVLNGNYVDVTNIEAMNKLPGNPSFEVMAGDEVEEGVFEEVIDPGDVEKRLLIAEAEVKGVKIDKRWGVDKIKAALDADHS